MLEVKDIVCGYNKKFLLRKISFELEKGEIMSVIGPNGSGKTTLIRAITKVIPLKSGAIILNGRMINQMSYKEIAKEVAVVSQFFDVGFNMRVEEFVLLGRLPFRRRLQIFDSERDYKICDEAMKLTGVKNLSNRFLSELSGGERRLVAIASALAQMPKLLILDEPTAYLDIAHQIKILETIKELNKQKGLTVMLVLHDLNLASEYSDKIILLNNGYLHKCGRPQEVLTYKTIEEVYKTVVIVKENPISHKPFVIPVPGEKIR